MSLPQCMLHAMRFTQLLWWNIPAQLGRPVRTAYTQTAPQALLPNRCCPTLRRPPKGETLFCVTRLHFCCRNRWVQRIRGHALHGSTRSWSRRRRRRQYVHGERGKQTKEHNEPQRSVCFVCAFAFVLTSKFVAKRAAREEQ